MNYGETIEYLYRLAPAFERVGASAYKEGLGNTLALDEHFGHPHRRYKTIHVAGTNGKGSTAHAIASVLMADGYKVGLYTSPHLVDFCERIRVDGKMIPHDYVIDFVERHRNFFATLSPSFFEITTALAFKYFADAEVDIAVVEVGLGGRLDCTNIITPELCVITNISLDHTQFLGDTVEKIAGEKAGIIKRGVPVVIGEHTDATRPVFIGKAMELGSPIIFAQDTPEVESFEAESDLHSLATTQSFGKITTDLRGDFQRKNINTVLHAAAILLQRGIIRSRESVARGLTQVGISTGLCGRWQTLSLNPRVIADTGHNPGAWKEISRQLRQDRHKTLRVVFGIMADKDIQAVVKLMPREAEYYVASPQTERAMPAAMLAEIMACNGLSARAFPTSEEALRQAKADYSSGDLIFIGGSNYLLSEQLPHLILQNFSPTEKE